MSKCTYAFQSRKQICLEAKGESYQGSCHGDSGGPAFPLGKNGNAECLYGVVSFGSPRCDRDGVYTRVSAYIDWIVDNWP